MRNIHNFSCVLLLGLFVAFVSIEPVAAAVRSLPRKEVAVVIKDRPFRETITKLCQIVEISCTFGKDADVDKTYLIEVENLRWDLIFTAALNAYKFRYRWTSDTAIEIYK